MANATIVRPTGEDRFDYCNNEADRSAGKATVGAQITKASGWITAAGRILLSSKTEVTGTGIMTVMAIMIEIRTAITDPAKNK